MKIAVLGAHGKTGKEFVIYALEAGHHVRAGIRGKNPFEPHERLEVVQCDATNVADLEELIFKQDAVVSLLGHRRGSKPDVQTQAMKLLVERMHTQHITRIITLTGTGVRIKGDKVRFVDHIITVLLKLVDPHRMRDGNEHVAVLQHSDLNWTVVRVFKLTGGKRKQYVLTKHGPVAILTSRKTVAAAIEELVKTQSFIQQLPMISS